MAQNSAVCPETRAYIKHKQNTDIKKLICETGVSRSTIYRIWKKPVVKLQVNKSRKGIGGRPEKMSTRAKRRLKRTIKILRTQDANWTVKRLMARSDVTDVSRRTVSRFLNQSGYSYLQARKKGLLSDKDKKIRQKFAKSILKDHTEDIWTKKVAFYLDGVGFVYKRNPRDQALAPTGRVWRTKQEGLISGCTAKGRACGTGGKYVKLIVAISHDKGVVCCQRYDKMNGEFFNKFLLENFETMVAAAGKNSRCWIQDGDPSQNSALALKAMRELQSELLSIPPRSPDINPIENVFGIAKRMLGQDAIDNNITVESIEDFENRIRRILHAIPLSTINNIIESMHKRMQLIVACKGARLKY